MWYETNNGELINLDRITLISLTDCKIRFDEPAYFEDYVDHCETFKSNEEAQKNFEKLKFLIAAKSIELNELSDTEIINSYGD